MKGRPSSAPGRVERGEDLRGAPHLHQVTAPKASRRHVSPLSYAVPAAAADEYHERGVPGSDAPGCVIELCASLARRGPWVAVDTSRCASREPTRVATIVPGSGGSVLQLSMRRVHDLVAFCAPYELEDVVAEVTGADRVEITNYEAVEWSRRAYKLGRMAAALPRAGQGAGPVLAPAPRLTREYELFFPVFNHPFELFALAAVPDWRARCRRAACLVSEIWVQELPEYLIELLADFDHLFVARPAPGGGGGADRRPSLHLPAARRRRGPLLALSRAVAPRQSTSATSAGDRR